MADATTTSSGWYDYNVQDAIKAAAAKANQPKQFNNSLGKDAFLQLMMAQMKSQDPMDPMDDKAFLAQMAQFTALEQAQNTNQTAIQTQAFSLIGKAVQGNYKDDTTGDVSQVTGTVSSVTMKGTDAYLTVNGRDIPAKSVTQVLSDPITNMNNNIANNQSFALIGKTVQAVTLDSNLKPTGFVEGKVNYVKFDGQGGTILMIGSKEVYPKEVTSVGAENMLIGKAVTAQIPDEDGKMQAVTGTVDNVKITGDKAYLQIAGYNVPIQKINYATDALALVGENIVYSGISGKVTGVDFKQDGLPYLMLGDKEISFTEYSGIKTADSSTK